MNFEKAARLAMSSIICMASGTMQGSPVTLEAMKKIDGIFFTADTIEVIRKYQRQLHAILHGVPQPNHTYVGKYIFRENAYGAHQLAVLEKELDDEFIKDDFKKLLAQVLDDFEHISKEFETIIKEARHIMAGLIKESCTQRQRQDSLLLLWSHSVHESGIALIKREIKTLSAFDQFCTDLIHFFGDMVRSAPKACHMLEIRLAKWKVVRKMVNDLNESGRIFDQSSFLKYIKNSFLDKCTIDEITFSKVESLLDSFERQ